MHICTAVDPTNVGQNWMEIGNIKQTNKLDCCRPWWNPAWSQTYRRSRMSTKKIISFTPMKMLKLLSRQSRRKGYSIIYVGKITHQENYVLLNRNCNVASGYLNCSPVMEHTTQANNLTEKPTVLQMSSQ